MKNRLLIGLLALPTIVDRIELLNTKTVATLP